MAESKQYAFSDLPSKRMLLSGLELLHNTRYNKGTAFSLAERKMLHLEGLLPPCVTTQEEQADRILHQLDEAANDLQRYNILSNLEGRNRRLFYYVVINNVERCLPLVYTPTVGLACQNFGDLYQQSRGLYISLQDRGRIRDLLRNWREETVKAIVFTDGERILGLGDLGASGMGIPLGKMALYTALGGVNPDHCLPITLDTGTNNEKFLTHPLYRGLRQRRARGKDYDDFVEEFILSAQAEFGETVLLQFEDFANENAFRLLAKYQDRCTTFNDDIQGTAAVVTAGVIAAIPQSKLGWRNHRFLFYGAGSAGIGICELIVTAMVKATGCTEAEARGQIWLVDSKGLVFKGRKSGGINGEKEPYAHNWAAAEALGTKNQPLEVYVKDLGITGIFGVSAQPQTFTEPVIRQLAANCPHPIVFALSNPTSKSECTAEQAYTWSDGKALFASGSPFPNHKLPDGTIRVPGQGNNCYIFPGVGLGIVLTGARRVRNKVFLAAAECLAAQVTEEDLAVGCLYPSMKRVREVSARIAATVAADVYDDGLETIYPRPADLYQYCLEHMWVAEYQHYA